MTLPEVTMALTLARLTGKPLGEAVDQVKASAHDVLRYFGSFGSMHGFRPIDDVVQAKGSTEAAGAAVDEAIGHEHGLRPRVVRDPEEG
jgi:hypothetical protein